MEILAIRLRELRKVKKLTQKQVAQAIDIDERNYRGYELNDVEPSFAKVVALAEFFEVSLDYLAGREQFMR